MNDPINVVFYKINLARWNWEHKMNLRDLLVEEAATVILRDEVPGQNRSRESSSLSLIPSTPRACYTWRSVLRVKITMVNRIPGLSRTSQYGGKQTEEQITNTNSMNSVKCSYKKDEDED